MKYIQEYGKKLTHPHVILICGAKVWELYTPDDKIPFDVWINSDVRAWLNELPPVAKYSWMPKWSPWQPTIPAWNTTRPYTSVSMTFFSRQEDVEESRAPVRFARKDDAMKFKLVWA